MSFRSGVSASWAVARNVSAAAAQASEAAFQVSSNDSLSGEAAFGNKKLHSASLGAEGEPCNKGN